MGTSKTTVFLHLGFKMTVVEDFLWSFLSICIGFGIGYFMGLKLKYA